MTPRKTYEEKPTESSIDYLARAFEIQEIYGPRLGDRACLASNILRRSMRPLFHEEPVAETAQ